MNKYILGEKTIETTEKKYNEIFKDLGYVPFKEKKEEPKKEKVEKEVK